MLGLRGVLRGRVHGESFRGRGREDLFGLGRRVIAGVHVLSSGDDEEAHADEKASDQEQGEDRLHGSYLAAHYTTQEAVWRCHSAQSVSSFSSG